jgi:hypothetical protein
VGILNQAVFCRCVWQESASSRHHIIFVEFT